MTSKQVQNPDRNLMMTVAIILLFSSLIAQGRTVAEWDFTTGDTHAICGTYKATLRGRTNIWRRNPNEQCLKIGKSTPHVQEGLALHNCYPQLSPQGPFKLETTFRMQEQTSRQPYLFLWDNKSITYAHNAHNDSFHHGMTLFLIRHENTQQFTPAACIGHGTHSSYYTATPMQLDEAIVHTLAFHYDGNGTGTFVVDGQDFPNLNRTTPRAGAMSPAIYPLVIGDRTGSGPYFHFDGDILTIRLTIPSPKNNR